MSRKVIPFSTGSQFEAWKDFNCGECYRYECESTIEENAGCALAFNLDIGSITGDIPFEIAERIGIEHDHEHYVDLSDNCKELCHDKEMIQKIEVDPNQTEIDFASLTTKDTK